MSIPNALLTFSCLFLGPQSRDNTEVYPTSMAGGSAPYHSIALLDII